MSGNARRSRPPRAARDSWEHVASWYDGWVGHSGSRYHQALAIPALLELLEPQPREEVLDIGRYTGIDASVRLISIARRQHGREGRFLVGDARRLREVPGLAAASFEAAVFLLSIQDMDPLEPIFASLEWVLRPRSRVVVLMTHPAFRQPRHAGWGFDPARKLVYRRVDAYLTPMAVPMKAIGAHAPTRSYHRPVSAYVNGLAAFGFAVDAMRELPDLPAGLKPGRRLSTPDARANAEIPLFLAFKARRSR
ncbi:MAG: class I SAM-dependent methyltransferase [Chloroflexi bacterium]|nr:MAG: class I SAM-dependent methyltransferase [Chloroflexota bacterium]